MTIRGQVSYSIYSAAAHAAFLRDVEAGELGDVRVLSAERIPTRAL